MIIIDGTGAMLGAMFFGGIWAMTASIVFIIAAILFTASESFSLAYLAFVIYLIVFAIFGPVNPFVLTWHNPLDVFGWFIEYFVLGALYSITKYWSYVTKVVNIILEIKKRFIAEYKLTISPKDEIPEDFRVKWKDYRYNHLEYRDRDRVDNLRPTQQKALIMNWIAFWPFSALGLFVADPLRHLVTSIYEHLVSIYGKMYDKIVSNKINLNDLK